MTDPRPPASAANLRMLGAGDGSVMLYCGVCRQPLPVQPRPLTLETANQAWVMHLDGSDAGRRPPHR